MSRYPSLFASLRCFQQISRSTCFPEYGFGVNRNKQTYIYNRDRRLASSRLCIITVQVTLSLQVGTHDFRLRCFPFSNIYAVCNSHQVFVRVSRRCCTILSTVSTQMEVSCKRGSRLKFKRSQQTDICTQPSVKNIGGYRCHNK